MPDPFRIAALQPSISITLDLLGCLDALVACTRYCVDAVPALRDSGVRIIHDSWSASAEEIMAARPNLVLASVPYRMESLAEILKAGCPVLTFAPKTLNEILFDMSLLGRVMDRIAAADRLVDAMKGEIALVRARAEHAERPLVYCEEWGKPLIHSQRWVDELVEAAGGRCFGKPGVQTTAEAVQAADPDVMIFAWCGAGDRVPLEKTVAKRKWSELRAVREGRVYCIPDEWLNTPACTLMRGLRAIAPAVHPEVFREMQAPRAIRLIPSAATPSKL
jgi:iron complex transport system substrate-binding protein